jgi:integrase/recombinase XerD
VASFLGWCTSQGVEWSSISLASLARFKHFVEATPGRGGRARSGTTVNATLTAVCEFLRFCARTGVIEQAVAGQLSEPRWLRFTPPGFDAGESGQFRMVRARMLKARAETAFPEAFTPEQAGRVMACCQRPRERFMVTLLGDGGLRIGEALGLRGSDLHLLPDSRCVGCAVLGAHVHVRHRANPNGALARSRFPRTVPASDAVLAGYADYQHERAEILGEQDDCDMVFVNLYREPLGAPMTYRAAKRLFERLARDCGFSVRPHMFRHTAATNWVRAGTDIDVVRALHVSAEMSLRYGRLFDQTVRAEYERALTLAKQQTGSLLATPPAAGRTALPLLDGDWKQAPAIKARLAGGYCLRAPAQGACQYANICEHCLNFRADASHLAVLAAQRVDAEALAADAAVRGWAAEADRHRRLAERLGAIITQAQAG